MNPARTGRWLALLIALALGYALLAHLFTTAAQPTALGAAASTAPWALLALAVAWRSAHRVAALLACALLVGLGWFYWEQLERNTPWVFYLQHVIMFVALGAAFGVTLRPGQEALCTRLARAVQGPLSAGAEAYSRGVTLAWALFCAVLVAVSTLLFFLGPLAAWSVFANLLTLPLVGAMFLVEALVRARLCPELSQGGALRGAATSVKAYWESSVRPTPGPR
ncbi:MAG TPA: hypothetical protein VFB53_03845 [Burkholderiales bacterium]|nr:hypothetical protein [Burkholderiales bacterium]